MAQSNSGGLTVNYVRIVLLAGVALFATSLVAAQQIGWLDLTDTHPRDRIRAPHNVGSVCGGGSGFTPNIEISIAVVSLDKGSYSLGEEVTYEVKIQNSGKEPIEIPWTPHLGDLEPTDSSQFYTFLHAAVSLIFTEPGSNRSFFYLRKFLWLLRNARKYPKTSAKRVDFCACSPKS
jgi:hypothetical protein